LGRFSLGASELEKRWVFEAIVEDDEDAVGLIGYALYKCKKHTLAKTLREQGMEEPDIQTEVQTFHDQFLRNNSVEEYRNKATDYLDQVYSQFENKIRTSYQAEKAQLEKQLDKDLKKFKRDFINSVKEYDVTNKPWHSKLWAFLISGIPGIASSFLIFCVLVGGAVFFVSEERREEILTSLVVEYIGVSDSQKAGPENPAN